LLRTVLLAVVTSLSKPVGLSALQELLHSASLRRAAKRASPAEREAPN
jgi:hypothetical protein